MTLASMSLALFGASMARSNLVVKVLTIQPPNRNRSDLWIFQIACTQSLPSFWRRAAVLGLDKYVAS